MSVPSQNQKSIGPIELPNINNNFGLTKSEFDAYVNKLYDGDESLFTKIFKSHFNESIVHLSYKFKISRSEAHDICMDTLIEFRHKLIDGKIQYGNLKYLYNKMATNNHLIRMRNTKKVDVAIDMFTNQFEIDKVSRERFLEVLDESLEQLSDKNKDLINKAFFFKVNLQEYAEKNGMNYATLRKQKQRAIDKLKTTFFELLKVNK